MGTVRILAAALTLAVAGGAVRGQLEVRFFQVGDLVSERSLPALNTGFPVTEAMEAAERPSFSKVSTDELVELPGIDWNFLEGLMFSLAGSLDPEGAGQFETSFHSAGGGVLRATHTPRVLDALDEAIAGVRINLRRGIQIELLQVADSDAAGLSPGPLSREVVDRLRPRARVLGRTDANHMVPVRVQTGSAVAYVGDYEVEVAGESRIGAPKVFQLRDGIVAGVEAGVLVSGQVAIHGRFRISRLKEMRVRDTEATWLGRLQLPVVDFQAAAGAGIVEPGGGILMGTNGGEGEAMILITATVDGRQARAGGGTELLASAVLGLRKRALPSLAGSGEREESVYVEPHQFAEALPSLVPSESWGMDETFSWTDRGFIAIRGQDGLGGRVREALARLEAAALKSVGLELRYGLVPAEGLAGLSAPGADLARVAGSLDGRMLLSSLSGEDFEVAAGREQALIQGYDVEIAQKSSIADPYVAPVFDGVVFRGNLQASGGRTAQLAGEFLVADSVQEPVAFDPKCTDIGVVEQARQRRALAILSSELVADRWTVVHVAGAPDQDRGFVILARLRL